MVAAMRSEWRHCPALYPTLSPLIGGDAPSWPNTGLLLAGAGRQMIQDMSGVDTMAMWPHIHRYLIATVTQWVDIQIYRYTTLEAAWLWCLARPACSTTTTSPRWRTASLQRWLAATSPHQSTTAFYCHPPQHFTYEKDPNNSKNFKTSFICSKHKRVVVDNPYVYISMKYRV